MAAKKKNDKPSKLTLQRVKTAKKNGKRLGRKPKPESEKKKGWARRFHPSVIEKINELAKEELKSDTELVEDVIFAAWVKAFPAKAAAEALAASDAQK